MSVTSCAPVCAFPYSLCQPSAFPLSYVLLSWLGDPIGIFSLVGGSLIFISSISVWSFLCLISVLKGACRPLLSTRSGIRIYTVPWKSIACHYNYNGACSTNSRCWMPRSQWQASDPNAYASKSAQNQVVQKVRFNGFLFQEHLYALIEQIHSYHGVGCGEHCVLVNLIDHVLDSVITSSLYFSAALFALSASARGFILRHVQQSRQ